MEFGPLNALMKDPSVEEVWINSPHRIFIARAGVSELTNLVLSTQEVQDLVERLLMWGGRRLDLSHPFVDARLPDGSRLHVAIPEVTAAHWAVNIRKHLIRGKSLQDLASLGVMTDLIANYLQRAVASGLNILVSGSTQAGKTTLLNALVSATPLHNRVITIEEVFELKPKLPDCVALQTRPANLQGEGEIPLRKLIKETITPGSWRNSRSRSFGFINCTELWATGDGDNPCKLSKGRYSKIADSAFARWREYFS